MNGKDQTVFAWHFVGSTLRDGRPIPADGEWLVHTGPIEICDSGLHASRRPWHALPYAPGSTLCYVECRGDIVEQSDKLVCRERRILVRADLTETLRYFARMQALSVGHLWQTCPPDVVLDYLMTGDESIRSSAWKVAQNPAREVVWRFSSAWEAVRVATWSSAWVAAWEAAWVAARAAVGEVAWTGGGEAAWVAAGEAARKAIREAGEAAGEEFDALVHEQFGLVT